MSNVMIVLAVENYKQEVGVIELKPTGKKVGVAKKYLVNGEEVAINDAVFSRLKFYRDNEDNKLTWSINASEEAILNSYKMLMFMIVRGGDASIPVKKVGKGPTEKSCKVKISNVVHPKLHHDDEIMVCEHTITVPVSALEIVGGVTYLRRWKANRFLHERIFGKQRWPKYIRGGVWLGAEKVWDEIFEPILKKIPEVLANAKEEKVKKERLRLENEEKRKRQIAIASQEREKENERKKLEEEAKARKKKERMDKLETIHVKWAEWKVVIKVRNEKYRSWEYHNETVRAENCILKFSGIRVYIILEDGQEIIKKIQNVTWEVQ